jgi:N utilization substance protein B
MQVLYALSRDPDLTLPEAMQRYRRSVQKSYDLYLFNLLVLYKIAAYSLKEYDVRKAKLLPSDEDKHFTPRLWENELIQFLHKNLELEKAWHQSNLVGMVDQDAIRMFYNEFAKTPEYAAYLSNTAPTTEHHRGILLQLFKDLTKNENFDEYMEDNFPTWWDDESLVVGAMKKTIKALPENNRFFEDYRPDPEATREFGEELLRVTFQRDKDLLLSIEPTLQNWDAERVAVMDMIILKMAVCELMYFPTIPTKVTLNEYVDVSKLYSTDRSKDFINGILDRLMKALLQEGKIVKEGRGLIE